jgi:CRISPR-associated endonuclease/helicase Cas3
VQFFESLYSNAPRRCRKLHNIAKSVVIVDEVQALNASFLLPCVAMLDELALNFRTSVLLCTATQPTISDLGDEDPRSLKGGLHRVSEIIPPDMNLHDHLRRVTINIADDGTGSTIGELRNEDIVAALQAVPQALCVVNTREHARDLFLALREAGADGAAHLSALMCPAHRSIKLAEYRQRLDRNQPRPLRLITTALVEAGVDIDFPRVWRCLAGLGSIAQAAGRCNREGYNDARQSLVTVFASAEVGVPGYLADDVAACRLALQRHRQNPLSPAAIDDYYSYLYRIKAQTKGGLDAKSIMAAHEYRPGELLFPFADIAAAFRLIEDDMIGVIIPYSGIGDGEVERLVADLRAADRAIDIARRLQRYLVSVPRKQHDALRVVGAIEAIAPEKFGDDWWLLVDNKRYDDALGLDPGK